MPNIQFQNYAQTTLTAPVAPGATSMLVNSTGLFPAIGTDGAYFWATIIDAASINSGANPPAQREIVKCTSVSANIYTVVRGQDQTSAQAWNVGDYFQIRANTQAMYDVASSANGMSVGITIDGGGSVITTGVKGYITVPFVGLIRSWYLVADVAGSIVIDVWKVASPSIPNVGNTIAGSQLPTLSASQSGSGLSLNTWTNTVSVGDTFAFNVNSASTVKRVTLTIRVDV